MIPVYQLNDRPGRPCCFCRRITDHVAGDETMACCQSCADVAQANDVPTQEEWERREFIASLGQGVVLNPRSAPPAFLVPADQPPAYPKPSSLSELLTDPGRFTFEMRHRASGVVRRFLRGTIQTGLSIEADGNIEDTDVCLQELVDDWEPVAPEPGEPARTVHERLLEGDGV